jgi:hypothetical protein
MRLIDFKMTQEITKRILLNVRMELLKLKHVPFVNLRDSNEKIIWIE